MRSSITILLLCVASLGLLFSSRLLATDRFDASPAEQRLPLPDLTPDLRSSSSPTVVTISLNLSEYPEIRWVKLQYFDPTTHAWRKVRHLFDNGRAGGDRIARDRIFTTRVRLFDEGNTTTLAIPKRQRVVTKAAVHSPLELRLKASDAGQKVVSAAFVVPIKASEPGTIYDAETNSAIVVSIPSTIEVTDYTNAGMLRLTKRGADGYSATVRLRANPDQWPIEEWIVSCIFGPCTHRPMPGGPQALLHFPRELNEQPIVIAGLQGYRLTLDDIAGKTIVVVLNDPGKARVIEFTIWPEFPEQSQNLTYNLDEALSVIDSVRP